jgi:hypothetical protein
MAKIKGRKTKVCEGGGGFCLSVGMHGQWLDVFNTNAMCGGVNQKMRMISNCT